MYNISLLCSYYISLLDITFTYLQLNGMISFAVYVICRVFFWSINANVGTIYGPDDSWKSTSCFKALHYSNSLITTGPLNESGTFSE